MKHLFLISVFTFVFAAGSFLSAEEPIKHKLLLLDESRGQLLYADETDPAKNWAVNIEGGKAWGLQLIGNHRVLVAMPTQGGYREYDLTTQKVVREFFDKSRFGGALSAIRFPDGRTVIASERGKDSVIYLLDADNNEAAKWVFADSPKIRQIRRTSRNTLLFGAGESGIREIDLTGKILRQVNLDGAKYNYHVTELPSGNLFSAAGYGGFLAEIDKENNVVRKIGGKPEPQGVLYHFIAQFDVLKNGHIVAATWTGHGADDSKKGQQVVEFDAQGNVVWKWHNPQRAGSILGVIVLDDRDTQKFYDDTGF